MKKRTGHANRKLLVINKETLLNFVRGGKAKTDTCPGSDVGSSVCTYCNCH